MVELQTHGIDLVVRFNAIRNEEPLPRSDFISRLVE